MDLHHVGVARVGGFSVDKFSFLQLVISAKVIPTRRVPSACPFLPPLFYAHQDRIVLVSTSRESERSSGLSM